MPVPVKRAIVTAFHKYTPFGAEYYEPMLDFFIQNMKKYQDEFDMLYIIDSTWNIGSVLEEWGLSKIKIIKVSPHLRYYDAYKEVLPQIKESLVLFMDNDMVVYRKGIIKDTFDKLLGDYDVVSIYDTIGTFTSPLLNGKSKFCPYFFATGTAMLRDFTNCEWGPNMPEHETLGKLTEKMLEEKVIPYEQEEDKSSLFIDGTEYDSNGTGKSKDLGYYHIRAGSTPAYLLATKKYGDIQTYKDYLNNQPRNEYLRQLAWYWYMAESAPTKDKVIDEILQMLHDIFKEEWTPEAYQKWISYINRFNNYHRLV